jgi:hypothetical protein
MLNLMVLFVREKGTSLVSKLGERAEFAQIDIQNASRLKALMEG